MGLAVSLGILGVLATGHYALCGIGENVPELVFGQVGIDPLEQVWREHPLLSSLHAGLPGRLEGICSRCLMKGPLPGFLHRPELLPDRRSLGAFWFCEEAEKTGLFPASRRKADEENFLRSFPG